MMETDSRSCPREQDPRDIHLDAREQEIYNSVASYIREGRFEPPPLPSVAQEIFQACTAGATSASQLAEIAHRDSFIAGRVLQLANSAFFSRGAAAQTLRDAIVRIGQNELRNLVMAIVLKGRMFDVPEAGDLPTVYWQHSLASALAAGLLASESGWAEPHRAFLAGLMHDVGKPVVLRAFVELRRESRPELSMNDVPVIAEKLHTMAGAMVAQSWKLDEALDEVIRLHHQPVDAELDEKLCSLVALSDAVCSEVGVGAEAALPGDISTHPVAVFMGLGPETMSSGLERTLELLARYALL